MFCSTGLRAARAATCAAILAVLTGCASARRGDERPLPGPAAPGERVVTILAINDVYHIAAVDGGTRGGLARLRTARRELEEEAPDLLLLHAGDLLSPSLLSRQFFGAQMIDVLNLLDGDADAFDDRLLVTLGNHEFDRGKLIHAGQLDNRIAESDFRWLGTNLVFARGENGEPLVGGDHLVDTVLIDSGGVRVGIFGATIDLQPAEYVEAFGDPLETARSATAELRQRGAELVIGLTHLSLETDQQILATLGDDGPDLIVGGHEHDRQLREVEGRIVIKADADARTASLLRVTPRAGGPPRVEHRWLELGPEIAPDPQVARRVAAWSAWYDEAFCMGLRPAEPLGCLAVPLGRTAVELIADELTIRRFETNLGNWLADLALEAYAAQGAQIAFLNSGSMRLNQNVPAGTEVTRRQLQALLPFPTELALIRISGATLERAIEHAISSWTGNGHYLQIAGFAFRHDPETGTADRLTLLGPDGPRPIAPDDELLLATSEFLVDPARGRDGFTMLDPAAKVDGAPPVDLRTKVTEALAAAGDGGIAPQREGRICTIGHDDHDSHDGDDDPCLAVPNPEP